MYGFSSLALGLGLALAGSLSAAHPSRAQYARVVSDASALADSYDYVIVGGGTSGLTVGDRLSEDGKYTVLVIEYGQISDAAAISTVQGGFSGMQSQFMYSINSVPQTNLRGRTTAVLIGKVVGGSSAINAFMTVRGTAEDYDRWGSFFSADSEWSWKGMLPYFKRALNFVPPNPDVAASSNITYDTSYWGNTSTVYTSWPSFQYPGVKAIVDGFRGIPGVEFPEDSGSGKPGVYWYPQYSDPKTVTRSYARTGHWSNLSRKNYELVANSKVTKIVLDGTRATGVTFVPATGSSTTSTTITVKKEVILAAGGIHSPQIMQLSGLGPKALLDAAKITTIVDLPGVGQNFQDHPMLSAMFTLRSFPMKPSAQDLAGNRTFRAWADEVWAKNRTGPYSIATGNAAAWLPLPVIAPTRYAQIADSLAAQDPASSLPSGTDPTVVAGYKAQMASYAAAMRGNRTAFYNFVISGSAGSGGPLVALHPLSRGTVNIDTASPAGKEPIVDYRALSNPIDRDVMVELLRFTRRVFMDNPAMAKYQPAEGSPGASVTSQQALSDYLTQTLSPTEYHPVGTCAMMPRELGGVVDEKLKVYGVQGLRIVDGSIMPTLVGGNTCQTVYAVAEKAADLIKADAGTI